MNKVFIHPQKVYNINDCTFLDNVNKLAINKALTNSVHSNITRDIKRLRYYLEVKEADFMKLIYSMKNKKLRDCMLCPLLFHV
jgi:hypothetical protein